MRGKITKKNIITFVYKTFKNFIISQVSQSTSKNFSSSPSFRRVAKKAKKAKKLKSRLKNLLIKRISYKKSLKISYNFFDAD